MYSGIKKYLFNFCSIFLSILFNFCSTFVQLFFNFCSIFDQFFFRSIFVQFLSNSYSFFVQIGFKLHLWISGKWTEFFDRPSLLFLKMFLGIRNHCTSLIHLLYLRQYKPRLVYFLTPFLKTISMFSRRFF
jgi:hypothetical protein